MCDQRVELRAAFRSIDTGDGEITARIGGQSVDGLGRQTHVLTTLQTLDCLGDGRLAGLNDVHAPVCPPGKPADAPAISLR